MRYDIEELRRACAGRWPHILGSVGGLTPRQLDPNIGQPCPKCGGNDRFSAFKDVAETGGLCCRKCFATKNADGFSSLEWLTGRPFAEVIEQAANAIGVHPTGTPATQKPLPAQKPVQLERQEFKEIDSELLQRLEAGGRNELGRLAKTLSVSPESLRAIGAGFNPDEDCWTFPERTAGGKVCGVNRRFQDGSKKMMKDHRRGLIFANDWKEHAGPVLVVEGPSDTAAGIALGACVIGRPANIVPKAVLPELITLLKDLPKDRGIIVLAENDQSDDGAWPGRDGAIRTAKELSQALGRAIAWALPPEGSKDLRSWLKDHPGASRCQFTDSIEIQGTEEPQGESADQNDPEIPFEASKPQSQQRSFSGKSVGELWESATEPITWLVTNVLSADQPTVFAARQKTLKSTLAADLVVALASGYSWLGRFEIPQRKRVLLLTGESTEKSAIRKVRRAAEARNLRGEDLADWIRIEATTFPNLPSGIDCDLVNQAVQEYGIEVVLLDPLYMGLQGLNTANLTEVGPALRRFMEACRPASLIIVHHIKKSASFDDAPNLEDLSQAGIAEFAGNFWLMGRIAEYTGDGVHQLAVRHGGRDEQFGLLKLEFDEQLWTAQVSSLVDHREDLKARRDTERVNSMTTRILDALERNRDGLSEYKLAVAAGTQKERGPFQTALSELHDRDRIELIPEFKPERAKVASKGWKLKPESTANKTTANNC